VGAAQGVSSVQTFYLAVTSRALTLASAQSEIAIRVAGDLSPMQLSQNKIAKENSNHAELST
jgi:hypothetical protein